MNKLVIIILWLSLGVTTIHYCHDTHRIKNPQKMVQDRQPIIKKKEKWKQIIQEVIKISFIILLLMVVRNFLNLNSFLGIVVLAFCFR
ncbi:MAG: hypothetical protein AAF770_01285 [Bacteroidota bacterium]